MKILKHTTTHQIASEKQTIIYSFRLLFIIIILIFFVFFKTEHSFSKLLTVGSFLLLPLIFEAVALLLKLIYINKKNNILNYISLVFRVLIIIFIITSFYSFSKGHNDTNLYKAQSIYNTLTSEALIGISEDENTKYVENTYHNFDERPTITKKDYAVLCGRIFDFAKRLDIKLSRNAEDVEAVLETDFEYIDNIPDIMNSLVEKMSIKDVNKSHGHLMDTECWKEYKTDDGYTCLTYYPNRKHEYQNMYSLIIVGNGKVLTLNLNAFLSDRSFNFDEMNIEEYYIDFLRKN